MEKKTLLGKIENYLDEKIIKSDLSDNQKVHQIIIYTSCFCAVIATQPLPFADIFILTPIQGVMVYLISKIRDKTDYGNKVSRDRIDEIFKKLGFVLAGGQTAQHVAIALYKIGLPFLGGFMTIPLVFTLTYAMGKSFDFYFNTSKQKTWNQFKGEWEKKKIKEKFKEAKKEARKMLKGKIKEAYREIRKIFKDKNLSLWEKLKKSVETLVKKITD